MPSHAIKTLILTAAISTGTASAFTLCAPRAFAGDQGGVDTSCSASQAVCNVTAHDPGGSATGGTTSANTGGSPSGAASQAGGSTPSQVHVTCRDTPLASNAPQLVAFGSPKPPPGKGHWVLVSCQVISPNIIVPVASLRWQTNGKPLLPDPAVLAAQAESKLALPKPLLDSSPAAGYRQVVRLPTWTWIPKTQWAPLSATAAVPGESVTATATPAQLAFSWGDGTSSTCQGPGTTYTAGHTNPAAPSPTCGHTYQTTSATAPGQQFPVTATLTWRITWAGGGQTGTLPDLTTTTTAAWTVEQVESVLVQGSQ